MMSNPDDLDVLLVEIRKTIKDNRVFLANLGDENPDGEVTDPDDVAGPDEAYEEL